MTTRERFRLRPLTAGDLEQVLTWRNSERIRSAMFSDHLISVDEHHTWFERLKSAQDAVSLIFEYDGQPLGVVNITQIDKTTGDCTWGFYLGEPDALPGSGTLLGTLGLEYVFSTLGLNTVIGEAFAFNSASIAFHTKLGFSRKKTRDRHVLKDGKAEDVFAFSLSRDNWQRKKPELEKAVIQPRGEP